MSQRTIQLSPAGVVFWENYIDNTVTATVTEDVANEKAPNFSTLCGFVPHNDPWTVIKEFVQFYGEPAPLSPALTNWLNDWTYLPNNLPDASRSQ